MSLNSISFEPFKEYIQNNQYNKAISLIQKKYKNNIYLSLSMFFDIKNHIKENHSKDDIFRLIITIIKKSHNFKLKKNIKMTKNYFYPKRYDNKTYIYFFEIYEILNLDFEYFKMFINFLEKENKDLLECVFDTKTRTLNDGLLGKTIWTEIIKKNIMIDTIKYFKEYKPDIFYNLSNNGEDIVDFALRSRYSLNGKKTQYKDVVFLLKFFNIKEFSKTSKDRFSIDIISSYSLEKEQKMNLLKKINFINEKKMDFSDLLNYYILIENSKTKENLLKKINEAKLETLIDMIISASYKLLKIKSKAEIDKYFKIINHIFKKFNKLNKTGKISLASINKNKILSKDFKKPISKIRQYNFQKIEFVFLILLNDIQKDKKEIRHNIENIFINVFKRMSSSKQKDFFSMMIKDGKEIYPPERRTYSAKNKRTNIYTILLNKLIDYIDSKNQLNSYLRKDFVYNRYELSKLIQDYDLDVQLNLKNKIFAKEIYFPFYFDNTSDFLLNNVISKTKNKILIQNKVLKMNKNSLKRKNISKREIIKFFSKSSNIKDLFYESWFYLFVENNFFDELYQILNKEDNLKSYYLIKMNYMKENLKEKQRKKLIKEINKNKIFLLNHVLKEYSHYNKKNILALVLETSSISLKEDELSPEKMKSFIKKELFLEGLKNG